MENIFENTTDSLVQTNGIGSDYQRVVDNLSEVVWSMDLTVEPHTIHYLNEPRDLFLGRKRDTIPSDLDQWRSAIHPDDRERILEEFVTTLETGRGSYSYRFDHGNGDYRYVLDRITVTYEDKKPVRIDGLTIDVDEIRKSRLNLELSQQKLKSIVDSIPDPVFISSKVGGKVLFANEVLFRVFGLSPDEFLGAKAYKYYDDFDGRRDYMLKLSEDGKVQNHELVLTNNKGESFWVNASTMPLEFQNEDSYITVLQNVTFRKKLEKELQHSNDRYQLAVEGTNDVIWEYDFKYKKSYLSPQFWARMGFEPKENPLDEDLLTKFIHEDDQYEFISKIQNLYDQKLQDFAMESRLVAIDGQIVYVFIKARMLYTKEGTPRRVVGSISNITDLKEAESQLKESQERYRIISENSSDCICLQTADGRFVFVSPSSEEILGYTPEELQELRLRAIIHEDHLRAVSDQMLKVIQGEQQDATISFRARHKNGEYLWLETKAGAIYDSKGGLLYLQTSTRDIHDRVLAEEKLRESEERYKLISENSHDIVSLMDLKGDYLFISPSIKDTMGYEVEEFLGRNTTEFIHPEDLPKVMAEMKEAIKNKLRKGQAIFRFKHKNGDWRWIEVKGGIIVDDNDEPIFVRSTKTDITEKIVTERKLREKEEQYKLVSENSGDVIGLQNGEGTFIFLSPSCKALFGYTPEEFYELDIFDLLHDNEAAHVKEIVEKTIKDKARNINVSYRLKKKGGEFVWVETVFSTVLDSNGEFSFLQSSTRDISERIKAMEKERSLSKLKSSFISMASHEFRTPLTTIQSSNELINMYLDSSPELGETKIGKHVGRIRTELERLNSLLKDIFTLGRLDVGKTKLNKDITSLMGIIKQVVMEYDSLAAHDDRRLVINTVGKERQLNLDSQLISHVLANLVSNAFKYSEGKPAPELTAAYFDDSVEIKIRDYGIGIPESDKKQLFESFSRASNVGDIGGTGLGLVIVRQFVEMHGGTVTFDSKVGQGTTFTVAIPNV